MSQVVIDNPIINRPFDEPTRHFKFDDDGITSEIIEGRRTSEYFIPIARPKKRGAAQLALPGEYVEERREPNAFVNDVRRRVGIWRQGGYAGITPTTRRLLQYWTDPERERKLFFCQIEALETAIYLTECASKFGDAWIANSLNNASQSYNPGLNRSAFKMATGSGKTVVMAMLIAWNTLNKIENPQDARFSDTFLIVTPGITIRDRLSVLFPNLPGNYYRERDIVPEYLRERLERAKILITNFHAFQLREKVSASKTTKAILGVDKTGAFTESPGEMVRRVCRELGTRKNIIVINDEAHHCYRRKQEDGPLTNLISVLPSPNSVLPSPSGRGAGGEGVVTEKLTGDDLKEAKQRDEEARIWISGIESVQKKIGVRHVYDLSATPFFLRGSGEPEGTLFPWVVSDFSLIDAIESGIVKIPRVPVADNALIGELPTNRELWLRIRENLPKKGAKTDRITGKPNLPVELEGALQTLYGHYRQTYEHWQATDAADGHPPPVFIVVCNNTNVSKMVYDYVGGWERDLDESQAAQLGRTSLVQKGELDIFRNDDGNGNWLQRPNTILIDSAQLEAGGAMSDEFKKIAAREIEEFKDDYRNRFPGRDVDDISDSDLLREVMNTVGKPGRLGEHVRCVVSVSMLTEGWDANTVTHILGVRAFGTQLLCEQVVGRALRRMSYAANTDGFFEPEYAEVFGIPFNFIPTNGETDPNPRGKPTRVRALEDRIASEIIFPRVTGYRFEISDQKLTAAFDDGSHMAISPQDVPTWTENRALVGESNTLSLEYEYGSRRMNEVAFELAKYVIERYFTEDSNPKGWLFPDVLTITRDWLSSYLTCKDETYPQLVLMAELQANAAHKIYAAIVRAAEQSHPANEPVLLPVLRPYDTIGSTRYVDFDTTKPTMVTDPAKCHINHVVADTDSWEQKMAQVLERHPQVVRYVKNQGLNFTIPYTFAGEERQYTADFIACIDDGHGPDNLLNLIVEVSGENRKDKAVKVETAQTFWIPAVNNHGGFGRWAYTNITDPWEAEEALNAAIRGAGRTVPV